MAHDDPNANPHATNADHAHADDPYFDHSGEAPPQDANAEVANPRALAATFVAMTLGVTVVVVVLVIYFNSYTSRLTAQKAEGWQGVAATREAQEAVDLNQLNGAPQWASQAEGTVAIPARQAMDLVVDQYRGIERPLQTLNANNGPDNQPSSTLQQPANN